jgi:hypothetical protein
MNGTGKRPETGALPQFVRALGSDLGRLDLQALTQALRSLAMDNNGKPARALDRWCDLRSRSAVLGLR